MVSIWLRGEFGKENILREAEKWME